MEGKWNTRKGIVRIEGINDYKEEEKYEQVKKKRDADREEKKEKEEVMIREDCESNQKSEDVSVRI